MPEMPKSPAFIAALVGVGIGLFLVIILVPMSFGYLDYYNLAFKRQKSTSKVFTDKVYVGGRHFIGPDFDFRVYPAIAQTIVLTRTSVFSKDTLEVKLDVTFQYFIRPQQLEMLHKKFQLTYNSVIRSSAMDALKAAAVSYTTEQFIKDRNKVEKAMEAAVRSRISGVCCEADCKRDVCPPGCKPLVTCMKETEIGLMVTLRYFHLTMVTMPSKVYKRYLKALLLVEDGQKEKYRLQEAVVKKGVDEAVKKIDNEANEVTQNATAKAGLITKTANAEALKKVGTARSEGLNTLMTTCGITDVKERMSLHYLNTLGSHAKAHLAVDFKNYVVGGK